MTLNPYSGPWRPGSKGIAVIALKRIVSRARPDLFPWRAFDDVFNERLRAAVAELQKTHGILPTRGNVGSPTFYMLLRLTRAGYPHEPAYDSVASNLLAEAFQNLHPLQTPADKVSKSIASYCLEMEGFNARWHYLQHRPFRTLGVNPEAGGWSDCSEFATAAYFWARQQTGVAVPDPNGRGYDGEGNTDTLYATNQNHVSAPYAVGDLAIYGPASKTIHVTICRQAGDASTAIFTSNGSEAGPLPTRVGYWPSEFLAVVRPRLAP